MRQAFLEMAIRIRVWLRVILLGPQLLAFLPAITLAGYWVGGEGALVGIALFMPMIFALAGLYTREIPDPLNGDAALAGRDSLSRLADDALSKATARARPTVLLAVGIDGFDTCRERFGADAAEDVLAAVAERFEAVLRRGDTIARLADARFGVLLSAPARANLETLLQLATRLQRSLEDPMMIGGARLYLSASVGIAAHRTTDRTTGATLIEAAEAALEEAMRSGTSAIRSYSEDTKRRARTREDLSDELPVALESDQIRPWFQPQIATHSGDITGFEVLARWEHPDRGLILPGEFLPLVESHGLIERLGEVMMYHAFNALRAWDATGLNVPRISINFSGEELRNPRLVDRIRWELDRFALAPDRLGVEVLETVIAQTGNDTIIHNLRNFAELGCSIDLDDFGTGHASITNIKRFSVGRIKIDRSFVTNLDTDTDKQNIVSAILTLAERLDLDTLAEGVESPADHATLARLGCGHLQGFGIARPMPFEKVEPWVHRYRARLQDRDGSSAESAAKKGKAAG